MSNYKRGLTNRLKNKQGATVLGSVDEESDIRESKSQGDGTSHITSVDEKNTGSKRNPIVSEFSQNNKADDSIGSVQLGSANIMNLHKASTYNEELAKVGTLKRTKQESSGLYTKFNTGVVGQDAPRNIEEYLDR